MVNCKTHIIQRWLSAVSLIILQAKSSCWPFQEEKLCVHSTERAPPSKGELGAQSDTKVDMGQWACRTEVCIPMAPEQEQEVKACDANQVTLLSQ